MEMSLDALISAANVEGASDLHLEPGLPAAVRVRGVLRTVGDPLPARALLAFAQDLVGQADWPNFLEQRSFDCSRNINGVRCRINVLQSARGVGFSIRILSSFQATLETLNLHPDLGKLVSHPHGFILVSGPTGSGKTSTLAAFIEEINTSEARHVITLESPIEYNFRPRAAYIRQREVGRDTPSFEQGLLDALREDPDVLMVGEMREPETMRLTLNAAETGHLVLATVHSSSCAEALQRVVSAFPAEIQSAVRGQLADCLLAVICQRLRYRPDLKIRVPECEILISTVAIRSFIRNGDFFKIAAQIEMGAEHGMWTFQRYQTWLESKKTWHFPGPEPNEPAAEPLPEERAALPSPAPSRKKSASTSPTGKPSPAREDAAIEIEPVEGGLKEVLKKLAD
jgi:twitching motility protein PilT